LITGVADSVINSRRGLSTSGMRHLQTALLAISSAIVVAAVVFVGTRAPDERVVTHPAAAVAPLDGRPWGRPVATRTSTHGDSSAPARRREARPREWTGTGAPRIPSREHPTTVIEAMMSKPPAAGAAPDPAEPTAADHDARALAAFDIAFEAEVRDEAWSAAAEADIAATLATAPGAPALDEVECRSTLCRVELHGEMASLPETGPFRETGWWIDDGGGAATLLLVREDAEIPFAG
jgi:hypothetical protein